MKLCKGCGVEKPLDAFQVSNRAKNGRQSRCRSCRRRAARLYREANREAIKERDREYRKRNTPEQRREIARAWRVKHRGRHRFYRVVDRALRSGVLVRPQRLPVLWQHGRDPSPPRRLHQAA